MSNNKFKVLIIEDEANICSFIQTLLETNGYQALVAQPCVMGLTMFVSNNPDLVFLDLGLTSTLVPTTISPSPSAPVSCWPGCGRRCG